jgi:hypothetical protein
MLRQMRHEAWDRLVWRRGGGCIHWVCGDGVDVFQILDMSITVSRTLPGSM